MSRTFEHLDKSIELVETYASGRKRYRKKKGPHGRNLCRYCGNEVPPRRISYCSKACDHRWGLMTSSSYARACVYARDKGVCAACGLDTKQCPTWRTGGNDWRMRRDAWLIAHGYGKWHSTALWEADHIVAVVDGGHDLGLDNFQTLCVPCHKKKTAELAARRARERRVTHTPIRSLSLDLGGDL
jgi:5-methylcytosine-specific restriction endonuclease McrA